MGKLTVIFYVFVAVVLGLFGCFSFLMTTVNPERLVTYTATVATTAATTTAAAPTTTQADTSEPKGLMKLLDYNEAEAGYTPVAPRISPPAFEQKPPKEYVVATLLENDQGTTNDTDPKKPKGRRSVNQRRKQNRGIVIMKVVDSDGRPRIEIVFYPKRSSNDRKEYKNNNILGSKVLKTNLSRNPILNIMPDDSIVFENKVISNKRDLELDYIISGDISDKTEAPKEIFDMSSLGSNLIETANHNDTTELNPTKDASIENPHSNVTTEMKMDPNEEVERKDVSLENKDNLNTASWNKEDIGINEDESSEDVFEAKDLGIVLTLTSNLNEEATEANIILMSSAQDISIEGSDENNTNKIGMDFNEQVQTKSYEEVSVRETDNLIQSTNPNFNKDIWIKPDIWINKTEISKDEIDTKNDELNLREISNSDEGLTELSTDLPSSTEQYTTPKDDIILMMEIGEKQTDVK